MLLFVLLVSLMQMASGLLDEELQNMYLTMPREAFVEYFNKQNYSWKMSEQPYNYFYSCVHPPTDLHKNLPIKHYDPEEIKYTPETFDARTAWPKCESIRQIFDQGKCGSCWAFGVATTASDRTCIHKGIHVNLSEQDFECQQSNVCGGGYPKLAFEFWNLSGLVSQKCKPYDIKKLHRNKCTKKCVNSTTDYNSDKHHARTVYGAPKCIPCIKHELSGSGPVEATMAVFEDFLSYTSGIYEFKTGPFKGYHSVRIIGYGVEGGLDYWLVANSWGVKWGESGFFRIKQNQPDIAIEDQMYSGIPEN